MASTISREDIIEMSALPDEHWKHIFDKLDRNADGVINIREFQQKGKGFPDDIPDDVKRKLFSHADVNGDGRLDYGEFLNVMKSPEVQKSLKQKMVSGYKTWTSYVVPPREVGAVDDVDGEYGEPYKPYYGTFCWPPPWFMPIISLVEIIIFGYYAWDMNANYDMGSIGAYGPVPYYSPLIYNPTRRYEAWRYVTYMFIHSGIMHILNNVLIQVLLGFPLETYHGWWRVAVVYFAGVIAGSLGTSIVDPTVYLAGASGGVYSIMTGNVATLILNWGDMKFPWIHLLIYGLIFTVDIASAIYNRYAVSAPSGTPIAYAAHLCGAVAGLLVGICVLKNFTQTKWEKWLWWASIITFNVLIFIAIIWNAAFPDYFPTST